MTLKEAFHQIWITDKSGGHEMEWERHWIYANNIKRNDPDLYNMTIYPGLIRKAFVKKITNSFRNIFKIAV